MAGAAELGDGASTISGSAAEETDSGAGGGEYKVGVSDRLCSVGEGGIGGCSPAAGAESGVSKVCSFSAGEGEGGASTMSESAAGLWKRLRSGVEGAGGN